jgi:hypothetical protein
MSAVSICTRSLTPSNDALRKATSLALPDWSFVLQISYARYSACDEPARRMPQRYG